MVVASALSDADIDRVFHALADTTRRDIVARVMAGESASISALAARYDMSFAAVQKHVAVLERAGLVTKVRRGREQIVHAAVEVIHQATALLESYEHLWQHRVARIDALLSEHEPTQGD